MAARELLDPSAAHALLLPGCEALERFVSGDPARWIRCLADLGHHEAEAGHPAAAAAHYAQAGALQAQGPASMTDEQRVPIEARIAWYRGEPAAAIGQLRRVLADLELQLATAAVRTATASSLEPRLPNSDGVTVLGYIPPPLVLLGGYTLTVEGDEFVAKRGLSKLRRQQLIGSIILVQTPVGLPLPLTIAGFEFVPSWADGGAPIVAYTLVYPEVAALLGVKNVCSGSLLDPLASAATILGGETYDNVGKTVHAGMTGWFTIACAGSAAAKMKLMGYAPQSNFPGTSAPSTVAARQATIKMITADYCGDGHSYTANGTPVVWQNHEGTVDSSDLHTPGAVEAVWTADGALCLEATRLPDAEVACELPSCAGLDVDDGAWLTHVAVD